MIEPLQYPHFSLLFVFISTFPPRASSGAYTLYSHEGCHAMVSPYSSGSINVAITNQKTPPITAVPRSAIPNALKFCIMPGLLSFKKNHFKFSYSFPSLTTDTNEKSNTDVINNTMAIKKDPAPINVKLVLRLPTCV